MPATVCVSWPKEFGGRGLTGSARLPKEPDVEAKKGQLPSAV